MPSVLHELYLQLLANRLTLTPDYFCNVLGGVLPAFRDATEVSATLMEVQPAEYRADMVIKLSNEKGETVYAIIVEVQLSPSRRKSYAWPAYVANLRARWKCPVSLLVITADERTADWAANGFEMDGLNRFTPYVLRPSGVPMITDEAQARENPELAVLSVIAHGRAPDVECAMAIAMAALLACADLDSDRRSLYGDIIYRFASEEARSALQNMRPFKYELQSEFARTNFGAGQAEGAKEERRRLLRRLLTFRFGVLDSQIESRIQQASAGVLDAICDRAFVARTLSEAMGDDR